jgi:hypothetical protein
MFQAIPFFGRVQRFSHFAEVYTSAICRSVAERSAYELLL